MIKTTLLSAIRSVTRLKVLQGRGLRRNPVFNFFVDSTFRVLMPKDVKDVEVQGSRMVMDLRSPNPSLRKTFQAYYLLRSHEQVSTEIFKRMVRPGDFVLDLGANVGYFTLLAARLAGPTGQVYCFEPEPTNFKYLSENIRLNGYGNVRAFNGAVSDRKGKLQLSVCDFDSGHHMISRSPGDSPHGGRLVEVDTFVIDELLAGETRPVSFVKMDIEGSEPYALKGMMNTLRVSPGVKVIMEFYPRLIRKAGIDPEELVRTLLRDLGFSVYIIPDDYYAMSRETVRVREPADVMRVCQGPDAHLNLFLEKGSTFESHFPVR